MNKFYKTVLLTALFVGTTDLLFATINQTINKGAFPEKMLNYMAGGGIGLEASMAGGTPAAFLLPSINIVYVFLNGRSARQAVSL